MNTGLDEECRSMLGAVTRVLRLTLVSDAPSPERSAEAPFIEFVAYTRDAVLSGWLALAADRLTDLLNASDAVELVDVVCLALDGRVLEADRVTVERGDLLAVKAGEPRGNPRLRHRTRQVAVAGGAGPYRMHGYLHGRPGTDPLIHLGRRPPMVPLTAASVHYRTARGWQVDEASTLIVNRDAVDELRLAKEDEVARIGGGLSGAA